MEIQFYKFKLRNWLPSDVTALVKYANNRNVSINLRDSFPYPYTDKDAREWIERNQRPDSSPDFAIATSDEAIGGIGIRIQQDVYKRSAEIGYWLGEPFWNKGICTMAVKALTHYAFEKSDIVRIYAEVFEWNHPSMRVLEKAGFTLEGRLRKSVNKDGKTIDSFRYALVRER